MRGEIILENGERTEIWLNQNEIQKLEHQVKLQKEYYQKNGSPNDYRMADEMAYGIRIYLEGMPDLENAHNCKNKGFRKKGDKMMNKREQAEIILEVLDLRAPTNINWAMEEHWLKAIEEGLREVEKHEQKL